MKSRLTAKRVSYTETPAQKSQVPVQLTHLLQKSNQQLHRMNIDTNKQNQQPNQKQKNSQQKRSLNVSPKRRVIHLKSISKPKNQGNSNSQQSKYFRDQKYSEVADFLEESQADRPSLVIEVDLKTLRKSMEDNLFPSSDHNFQHIRGECFIDCSEHEGKKATFTIKGKPYCDKCAAPLISKGFLAIKIDQKQTRKFPSQQSFPKTLRCNKQDRNLMLSNFIEELDKTQPILESVSNSIESYLDWLYESCQLQFDKFQQHWNQMMLFLVNAKQKVCKKFAHHKKCAQNSLLISKQRINKENENLSFMRNDIVKNIGRILDLNLIPDLQFQEVMDNFKQQLSEISKNALSSSCVKLSLPRIEIDLGKLQENIDNLINTKLDYHEIALQCKTPTQNSSSKKLDNYLDGSDPSRLSFGKQMEKIYSPTFKKF